MPLTKEQVIKMLDEHTAKAKKDPASATAFFATNAKILPNYSAAVSGKAAIDAQSKAKSAQMVDLEFKQTVADVINEGDLCIVDGTFVIIKGGNELDSGKFMTIFKKEGDSYKCIRMMHNTSRPMPGM